MSFGEALAGAMMGAGQGLVQQGENLRKEAREKREAERRASERQENRQWQVEDRNSSNAEWDRRTQDERNHAASRRAATASADANVYASLFGTESGGRFDIKNSEGYTGRAQFGDERLADFARANGVEAIDKAAFQKDPALQQKVEEWHFKDINGFIDKNGLDRFEGETIGGVKITRSGIIAMAHLGGANGAKRFLESGGKYNPADSNGTSLSGYARTHGGKSTKMDGVWGAIADPNTSDQARAIALKQVTAGLAKRKIVKGADGYNYYEGTGERVLPGVEAGPSDDYEKYKREAVEAGETPMNRIDYAQAKKGNGVSVTGPDGSIIQVGGKQTKLNEGESKTLVYATRAKGALETLNTNDKALSSRWERLADMDPTGLARELQSDEFQMAKQAGDEYLQAILRKDTGAAITEQEQELYGKTYLPQPGDSAALLKQKKASRKRAIIALESGMTADMLKRLTLAEQEEIYGGDDGGLVAGEERATGGPMDFSEMTMDQISRDVDVLSLSAEQLDALEARVRQLEGVSR